jgi:hypothetical protein
MACLMIKWTLSGNQIIQRLMMSRVLTMMLCWFFSEIDHSIKNKIEEINRKYEQFGHTLKDDTFDKKNCY